MSRLVRFGTVVLLLGACEEGGSGQRNVLPRAPHLSGPDTTVVGVRAEFEVSVYDPDGDDLRVFVVWGDGDTTDYGEFVPSGRSVTFYHVYGSQGVFTIRARCQDTGTLFSDWSDGRRVVVIGPDGNCLTSAQYDRESHSELCAYARFFRIVER